MACMRTPLYVLPEQVVSTRAMPAATVQARASQDRWDVTHNDSPNHLDRMAKGSA